MSGAKFTKRRYFMADYIITADSTADVTPEFAKENGIIFLNLGFAFGDEQHTAFDGMDYHEFYQRLRDGEVAKTNACIPGEVHEKFEEIVKSGKDILHLSFSSALSCSYNVAKNEADDLMDEYKERRIMVIDSISAAPGHGLLLYYAVKNLKNGMSLEDNAAFIEKFKYNLCHEFTVDDLKFLARGGRISKTTAVLGTMLSIKPVLHIDNEGRLINIGKMRGRKQALNALVDNMAKHFDESLPNDVVYIGHGDCVEDAEYVRDRVREKFGITEFVIEYICPTVGAHSGPGTVALFYVGKER